MYDVVFFFVFFYHRHQNHILLTWNESKELLEQFLKSIQTRYPNVHLDISIGTAVVFMNVFLENQSGFLFSEVYHDPDKQKYTLPYVTGNSIEVHSDWFRSALLRAVCYCTAVASFAEERIHLELTYLLNGYSLYFVETRVDHFFTYFKANDMRYCLDQALYDQFRLNVFAFIEQHHELLEKTRRLDDDGKMLHFHYLYEYGSRSQFDEVFQSLWAKSFKDHPNLSVNKSKICLTTKHRHSLNALLAQPVSCHRTITVKK